MLLALLMATLAPAARAQATAFLIKDINTSLPQYENPPDTTSLAVIDSTVYFVSNDFHNGRELWRVGVSGAGVSLVSDIMPGPSGSYPSFLTPVNDTLFFGAGSDDNRMLWRTDGTAAGTTQIEGSLVGLKNPAGLIDINGVLFFSATGVDGISGLWKSDGTNSGTVRIKNVDFFGDGSSSKRMVNVNGVLYFTAGGVHGEELWKSDGTSAGTVMVKDIKPGGGSSFPFDLTNDERGAVFCSA